MADSTMGAGAAVADSTMGDGAAVADSTMYDLSRPSHMGAGAAVADSTMGAGAAVADSTMGAGAAVADSTLGAGAAPKIFAPKSTLGVSLAGNLLEKMRVNRNGAGAEQAQIETEIARGIHA